MTMRQGMEIAKLKRRLEELEQRLRQVEDKLKERRGPGRPPKVVDKVVNG